MAYFLQHHERSGEIDRLVVMAFRGMAKSWITAAFALWKLLRNPQERVGVFSGSGRRAVAFVNFCGNLIREVPCLKHLTPRPDQLQSSTAFEVGPALPDQTPSLFAAGITSQIVGFRASLIIGDDVETNTNSMTQIMREKLADSIKEFDAIIKPGGQIIFLGTPQTEASIYNLLPARGYVIKIWPARFPTGKQVRSYGDKLARYITWKLEQDPGLMGHSTEPKRFSDEDLAARELSWTPAGFALQYMLDTSLADVERYPLRLGDLMCMRLDRRNGPDLVSYGAGEHLAIRDVQPIAFDGDRLYAPASVSESYSPWQGIKAFIDPSGKGKDETTLTIGAVLHSTPFLLKQAGWLDGFGEETLKEIAQLLVEFNVSECRVEEDFGQGMFAQLLKPVVKEAWDRKNEKDRPKPGEARRSNTEITSERAAKVQKELRILETLVPIFTGHRLVVDTAVFVDDYQATLRREGTDLRDRYSLMYQITRLCRDKDCLSQDDRVEGLHGMLMMFVDQLGLNSKAQAEAAAERRAEEELAALIGEEDDIAGVVRTLGRLRGKLRTGSQRAKSRR